MAKASTRRVSHSTTNYEVSVQRREGKAVAIIDIESVDTLEDGRGYAGQTVTDRNVLVVPLSSLPKLVDQIVSTLTYDMTADPQEKYDLVNDATKRIGLYSDLRKLVNTFYTVAEARLVLRTAGPGWSIAHLPEEEGDGFRNVIEVNQ